MTLPELLLWRHLRGRPGGFKFRRQHGFGPYVLDFFCVEAALCVEADGAAHDMGGNPARDERRDQWVAEQGVRTVRIPAAEILDDIEPVIVFIVQECASRSPSTGFAGPPPRHRPGRELGALTFWRRR